MSSSTQGAWACRHGVDGRDWCPECYEVPEGGAMTLDEQIRAKLDQQKDRWIDDYMGHATVGIGRQRATTRFHTVSDLGACHQAIRAALDLHASMNCNPCPTVAAIAEALNIQQEEP